MVTPHGSDPAEVFLRIYAGESAIRGVEFSDLPWLPERTPLATVDFEPGDIIPRSHRLFMARASELAVVAAHGALDSAGLLVDDVGPSDAGVYVGAALGGAEVIQDAYRRLYAKGRKFRPTTVPLTMANGPTSHISMRFRLRGPTLAYAVACASSALSVGEAYRAVREGHLNAALAGGTEAMLNSGTVGAWHLLGVLAKEHSDGPEVSSRPFDSARTGLVLGEGAIMLMLETEEQVEKRGVAPLAEIVGYGVGSDAHHLTEPHKSGQIRAMQMALRDGRLDRDAIQYVNAHATATPTGDIVEIAALKETFGNHAYRLAVSSSKSVHGHLVGAAGAMDAAVTCLALLNSKVPPTAHLTNPDPECDLDCVPCVGREVPDLTYALSNSFAFGGTNAALIFKRV